MTPTDGWIAGIGLLVGLFLDRCARRMAYEKSVFYPPRRHCPRCLQALPAWVAVPLVGRFLAGGRCRGCGERIPWRTIFVQLLTAVVFVVIYRFYVVGGGKFLPAEASMQNFFGAKHLFALAVYHALLFCFLLVAATVDWDLTLIPLSATALGSVVGIALGTFWYVELHPLPLWFAHASAIPRAAEWCDQPWWEAVWRWAVRDRAAGLPAWLESVRAFVHPHWHMNWNWYLGFATGVAGWLAGYVFVWSMDEVASRTLGRKALGEGDRDLLAMIGAYLGWQSAALTFVLSWVAAAVLALPTMLLLRRGGHFPFGPYIALGAGLCVAFWRPLFRELREVFMTFGMFFAVAAGMLLALAAISALVRVLKALASAERKPA